MKPLILGLLGRADSGKSTAAAHLKEKYGAQIFSFARPLKELAKSVFEFTDAQVYGTQAEKEAIDPRYGVSPRTLLICFGDGAREHIGSRVWIDACFYQIDRAQESAPDQPCVIEDVRYPNEAEAIHKARSMYGRGVQPLYIGHVIKLVCPDSSSSAYTNAPSERSVDEVSAEYIYKTIVSHKSPGSVDLKAKIDEVMKELL